LAIILFRVKVIRRQILGEGHQILAQFLKFHSLPNVRESRMETSRETSEIMPWKRRKKRQQQNIMAWPHRRTNGQR